MKSVATIQKTNTNKEKQQNHFEKERKIPQYRLLILNVATKYLISH